MDQPVGCRIVSGNVSALFGLGLEDDAHRETTIQAMSHCIINLYSAESIVVVHPAAGIVVCL